jgi:hypothetical protein
MNKTIKDNYNTLNKTLESTLSSIRDQLIILHDQDIDTDEDREPDETMAEYGRLKEILANTTDELEERIKNVTNIIKNK